MLKEQLSVFRFLNRHSTCKDSSASHHMSGEKFSVTDIWKRLLYLYLFLVSALGGATEDFLIKHLHSSLFSAVLRKRLINTHTQHFAESLIFYTYRNENIFKNLVKNLFIIFVYNIQQGQTNFQRIFQLVL